MTKRTLTQFLILSCLLALRSLVFAQFEETHWATPEELDNWTHHYMRDVTVETYRTAVPNLDTSLVPHSPCEAPGSTSVKDASNSNATYRLRIGDVVFISLYGTEEYKVPVETTVDPTGVVTIAGIGNFQAVGKTFKELRDEINATVKDQYPNSLAAISASQLLGDQYTILGEVNNPGTFPTTGHTTLLSAIGQSRGFPLRSFRYHTVDFADLEKAFLLRGGKEYIPIDFKALIRKGDVSQDVLLQGGDYIYIPSLVYKQVYIIGEVNHASAFTFDKTTSLMEAISFARGRTIIASSRAIILRGALCNPKVYSVDLNLISRGCVPDFSLQNGDIIYIPAYKFTAIRELIRLGISTFANAVAGNAGTSFFLSLDPNAAGINLGQQTPVIINPAFVTPSTTVSPSAVPGQ